MTEPRIVVREFLFLLRFARRTPAGYIEHGESMPGPITGRMLNRKWGVNAKHALYREDGRWYHVLEKFPGALFDSHGYVVFQTERDFRDCSYLSIRDEVNVKSPKGIAAVPGYVQVIK